MARDATMSQKLIKAIMMWYGEASFDRVLRMISITAMDDIAEMHPLTMKKTFAVPLNLSTSEDKSLIFSSTHYNMLMDVRQ